ncbi:MAG: DNA-binding protein Alba [Candidatus Woesearchaeota archaeon]
MTEDNSMFIGTKPLMNYVTGVVMQFTTKNANEVVIKARGKFIYKAVDVAEVVRKRFLQDQVDIKDIKIDSEEFKNKEGKQVRVSTMEITLAKK